MDAGEIDLLNLITKKKLTPNLVRSYWEQMLLAVQSIHDANVLHADLKPANFVLMRGELKLIDFNISDTIQNDMTSVMRENNVICVAPIRADCRQMGTLNYMPPESFMRSNCYNLGNNRTATKVSHNDA